MNENRVPRSPVLVALKEKQPELYNKLVIKAKENLEKNGRGLDKGNNGYYYLADHYLLAEYEKERLCTTLSIT